MAEVTKNLGPGDRLIRVILAVILIFLGLLVPISGWWRLLLYVVAIGELISAATAY